MLWMETFCFYCSVRLGVIVSAGFSIVQALIKILVLAFYGTSLFTSTKKFIDKNEQQNQDVFIIRVIDEITGRPEFYTIIFNVVFAFDIASGALAIYAALKLQKLLLIPFICSQFMLFLSSLGFHVIAMIILKKIVNLGILIGMTLAGGFYILYLGYSWAGAIGLFQIIVLVNSEKYKVLYGDDPLDPRELKSILPQGHELEENIKNTKKSVKPEYEFNEYKRKRIMDEKSNWQYGGKVISVIPVNAENDDDVELIHFNNWHWNELVGIKKSFK